MKLVMNLSDMKENIKKEIMRLKKAALKVGTPVENLMIPKINILHFTDLFLILDRNYANCAITHSPMKLNISFSSHLSHAMKKYTQH